MIYSPTPQCSLDDSRMTLSLRFSSSHEFFPHHLSFALLIKDLNLHPDLNSDSVILHSIFRRHPYFVRFLYPCISSTKCKQLRQGEFVWKLFPKFSEKSSSNCKKYLMLPKMLCKCPRVKCCRLGHSGKCLWLHPRRKERGRTSHFWHFPPHL